MPQNVRFVDQLKVGAYKTTPGVGSIDITNNFDNYILTATGGTSINGESQLRFDGVNLALGTISFDNAKFEISGNDDKDLLLIRNTDTGKGIRVNKDGVFGLIKYDSFPNAVLGGIAYIGNDFWVGL